MSRLIHSFPILCFGEARLKMDEDITVSKDINEVTCPYCVYYFFTPNARKLEMEYRQNVSTQNNGTTESTTI
jgi:hypothetical protein